MIYELPSALADGFDYLKIIKALAKVEGKIKQIPHALAKANRMIDIFCSNSAKTCHSINYSPSAEADGNSIFLPFKKLSKH